MMGCSPGDNECDDHEKPAREVSIASGFWLGQTPVTQRAYEMVIGQNPSHFKGPNRPVEKVNWDESQAYCRRIGGRLPTEAEWEYAARAGNPGSRYGDLDSIAWYDKNSGDQTHDVAQKQPNAWGLYDMLGNVWQWTADWYELNKYRALRGGSWFYIPRDVRVSFRGRLGPGYRYNILGLRCVGE
jgi:formylglycine-generating enzyme required for sulfatase activity